MSEKLAGLQRKLRTAACFVVAGLLVEAGTLYWSNPTSFLTFIGVGAGLVALGMAIYLIAIVTA